MELFCNQCNATQLAQLDSYEWCCTGCGGVLQDDRIQEHENAHYREDGTDNSRVGMPVSIMAYAQMMHIPRPPRPSDETSSDEKKISDYCERMRYDEESKLRACEYFRRMIDIGKNDNWIRGVMQVCSIIVACPVKITDLAKMMEAFRVTWWDVQETLKKLDDLSDHHR